MAPVPASPPSAPSWISTLEAYIGARNMPIVYTAILVFFIGIFAIGLIYVLRIYKASSMDEESDTLGSISTLVRNVTPPKTNWTPVKRLGSNSLSQHVYIDLAPETTKQEVVVKELPANVNTEEVDVVVISPDVDSKNEELVISELEVDISATTDNWLARGSIRTVDSDVADILTIKTTQVSVSDADAVDIGNAFLYMREARSPKALESPARLAKLASSRREKPTTDNGTTDSGLERSPSVTLFSSPCKSAHSGLLSLQLERSPALDRLACHVTPVDTSYIGKIEHVAIRGQGDARHALDAAKEDESFKHTARMAITPGPSYCRTPLVGTKDVSPGTYRTDDAALERTHALAATSVHSYRKPHKEVRFAGDKADIGDICRISVGAAYLKVKVSPPIASLRPLSSDSFYSNTDSLDSNASHRLSLLADLALGADDSVYDTSESSGSIAPSVDSAFVAHSSFGDNITSLSVSDPVSAAQYTDTGKCGSIIIDEQYRDVDANNHHLGPPESSQALQKRILKDCQRILVERRRTFEEQVRKRREEADKVHTSLCERRRQHRLFGLQGSLETAYPPPLPPDVGGHPDRNDYDSGDSDGGSRSPVTPAFGSWSGSRIPLPPLADSTEADVWTFLPGNTSPDLATSPAANSGEILIQYKGGEDVPLPPRRAFTISPSEEEMKPVIYIEESLDENAERNLHELGISCSTQALRNLIMRDCKEAIKRRKLEFEASRATLQVERAKQAS